MKTFGYHDFRALHLGAQAHWEPLLRLHLATQVQAGAHRVQVRRQVAAQAVQVQLQVLVRLQAVWQSLALVGLSHEV